MLTKEYIVRQWVYLTKHILCAAANNKNNTQNQPHDFSTTVYKRNHQEQKKTKKKYYATFNPEAKRGLNRLTANEQAEGYGR